MFLSTPEGATRTHSFNAQLLVFLVASNIAAGTSRYGYQEKIHFIYISYIALMEIVPKKRQLLN